MEKLSSKLLQEAVEQFSRLPGIGKKSALRMVLHLLKQEASVSERFSEAILNLRLNVKYCQQCHNISDQPLCEICSSNSRDKSVICVVEDLRDVIAIENTGQYRGLFHVLGGLISPVEGIGPGQLNIDSLVERIKQSDTVKEVILALNTTMEGDTTNFFIFKKLKPLELKVSVIARGIAIGDELEYADEITLGRSIINRTPYENTLSK